MIASFRWSAEKDARLRAIHGVGFADVVEALEQDGFLSYRAHPNTGKYPHQVQVVVAIRGYAYVVPAVTEPGGLFLKTLYPSRKATAEYLGKGAH